MASVPSGKKVSPARSRKPKSPTGKEASISKEKLASVLMQKTPSEPKDRKFFSPYTQSYFAEGQEEHLDSKYSSQPFYGSTECNFWLKDDMQYYMDQLRGRGAFATVWRAKERKTGRVFAVKIFQVDDDAKLKRGVRDEGQILDRLQDAVSLLISNCSL
jgi:hypothetical protein